MKRRSRPPAAIASQVDFVHAMVFVRLRPPCGHGHRGPSNEEEGSMRTIVTGGAGFIGSHLVDRLLADGAEVLVVDDFDPFYPRVVKEANLAEALRSPRCRLAERDIRDAFEARALVDEFRPDAIVHLAAQGGCPPQHRGPGAVRRGQRGRDGPMARGRLAGSSRARGSSTRRARASTATAPTPRSARPTRSTIPSARTRRPRRPASCSPTPSTTCMACPSPGCGSSPRTGRGTAPTWPSPSSPG